MSEPRELLPHDPRRRRGLRAGAGAAALAVLAPFASVASLASLAGCGIVPGPDTVRVSRAQLEAALARRFPYRTEWLGLFEVVASQPVLSLMPERNRLGASVDLRLAERVFGRELRGAVDFDGALRYEPTDGSVRLSQVEVGRVGVAGLPEAVAGQTGRLGALLARQLLDDLVLHTLEAPQREALRRRGVRPGPITVRGDGVEIALVSDTPGDAPRDAPRN